MKYVASLGIASCIITKSVPLRNPSPTTTFVAVERDDWSLSSCDGAVSPTPVLEEFAILVIA